VLFDVGLGAGANALAALKVARGTSRSPSPPPCGGEGGERGPTGRHLEILSFERDLGALALAASEEGARRLDLDAADAAALRALLARARHEEPGATWRLALGDAVEALRAERARAEVVFWDPFSPRVNPELWTVEAFRALRAACGPRAVVFTYSTATSVRSALLLAGFCVGVGDPSGEKEQTTAAACDPADLARPLDARWLARLVRSSAPLPAGAPPDALDRIRAHPQFA
jgi:queuine tRNA-ribosyltransferase